MQFPDLKLEALGSLIKDEADALVDLEKEIHDVSLDLSILEVRVSLFEEDDLGIGDKVDLRELPNKIAKLEKDRELREERLQKLQAQMPPETSDAKPPLVFG